jgi:hypothetical protein
MLTPSISQASLGLMSGSHALAKSIRLPLLRQEITLILVVSVIVVTELVELSFGSIQLALYL